MIDNGFQVDEPQISPDSRWLAYTLNDTGEWEVYLQPMGQPGGRVRVSTTGGGQPEWRADAKELFYASHDGQLMAVAVNAIGPSPQVGRPEALFQLAFWEPYFDEYATSADGQRFLVKVPARDQPSRIHVVLNWPSQLTAGASPTAR